MALQVPCIYSVTQGPAVLTSHTEAPMATGDDESLKFKTLWYKQKVLLLFLLENFLGLKKKTKNNQRGKNSSTGESPFG